VRSTYVRVVRVGYFVLFDSNLAPTMPPASSAHDVAVLNMLRDHGRVDCVNKTKVTISCFHEVMSNLGVVNDH
jgi:hypothetical protein